MPIIGTLPNNIQNGQTVDATPVMADFNFIVNQVNANGNPTGTLTAPSGTSTTFCQAASPLGWTTNVGVTDHTIQVNANAGGSSGGASPYSNVFQNAWTTGGHALTSAELATHSHGVTDPGHTHTDSGHFHNINRDVSSGTSATSIDVLQGISNFGLTPTASASANIQANTTGISIQNTGAGNAHTHTTTFNLQYIVMILSVKT